MVVIHLDRKSVVFFGVRVFIVSIIANPNLTVFCDVVGGDNQPKTPKIKLQPIGVVALCKIVGSGSE